MLHTMLATVAPAPLNSIIPITRDDADKLAKAAFDVAVEYDLARYLQGKTPALVGLAIVAATIYVPKVITVAMLARVARQAPRPPMTAAEVVGATETRRGAMDFSAVQ